MRIKRIAALVILSLLTLSLHTSCTALPRFISQGSGTPTLQVSATLATPTPTPVPAATSRPAHLPTPLPPTPAPPSPTPESIWLTGDVHVYPGDLHFEGDILTFEIGLENLEKLAGELNPQLFINGDQLDIPTFQAFSDPYGKHYIALPQAWDTIGAAGLHEITITLENLASNLTFYIEILPADQRLSYEDTVEWQSTSSECCNYFYLSSTPAERDLGTIIELTEDAVKDVSAVLGFNVTPLPIPVTLLDVMYANGGYAAGNDGISISYLDRAYNGVDYSTILRHEITHWTMTSLAPDAPLVLSEGLAVYVAGGHYQPGSIADRAALLFQADALPALIDLTENFRAYQHETAYATAGAFVEFLVETYGWRSFYQVYTVPNLAATGPEGLDRAMRAEFGIGLRQNEREFENWLLNRTPSLPANAAVLTVSFYESFRQYQSLYAPYQVHLPAATTARDSARVAEFLREPTHPDNIAFETMLINAHQALTEKRYDDAEQLLSIIDMVLQTGDFSLEPFQSQRAVADFLHAYGYEALEIKITGTQAMTRATSHRPLVENVTLERNTAGQWEIVE